jgi:hypothetical protein
MANRSDRIRTYLRDPSIVHNVRYGPHSRNQLDLYLHRGGGPPDPGSPPGSPRTTTTSSASAGRAVVVLVPGGAWVANRKAWGFLLARALARQGILVVVPDHRSILGNRIPDVVEDLHRPGCMHGGQPGGRVMRWTFATVPQWGGDPMRISLCGHSAGAHLAMVAVLEQVADPTRGGGVGWPVQCLRAVPRPRRSATAACHRWGCRDRTTYPNSSATCNGETMACPRFCFTHGPRSASKLFGGDAALRHYSPELRIRQSFADVARFPVTRACLATGMPPPSTCSPMCVSSTGCRTARWIPRTP